MYSYSGIEYLAMDVAKHYGLDKETFENRIDWVKQNQDRLETYTDFAENKYLYAKAVNHFRKALKGLPTGHRVALDASASGLQLMSVLTGDEQGCYMTGLIDPDKRTDAYRIVTERMNQLLGETISVPRKDAKLATMTHFYGSKKKPKEIFGYETPAWYAFYQALDEMCKGANTLRNVLIKAWDKTKLYNHWVLPDGFNVYLPVMETVEDRVSVQELNYTMTVQTKVNKPVKESVELAAHAVHSVDGYVLRTLVRRCNYNLKQVKHAVNLIQHELDHTREIDYNYCEEAIMPIELYLKTGLADIVCIQHIDKIITHLPTDMLEKMLITLLKMLEHEPFEVVPVHDEFSCHANHCNVLRYWYKEILSELAESNLLNHLLTQIMGEDVEFKKMNPNLATKIRESNYGLC